MLALMHGRYFHSPSFWEVDFVSSSLLSNLIFEAQAGSATL